MVCTTRKVSTSDSTRARIHGSFFKVLAATSSFFGTKVNQYAIQWYIKLSMYVLHTPFLLRKVPISSILTIFFIFKGGIGKYKYRKSTVLHTFLYENKNTVYKNTETEIWDQTFQTMENYLSITKPKYVK